MYINHDIVTNKIFIHDETQVGETIFDLHLFFLFFFYFFFLFFSPIFSLPSSAVKTNEILLRGKSTLLVLVMIL